MRYKLIIALILFFAAGLIILQHYYEPEKAEEVAFKEKYPHDFLNLHDTVRYIGMETCQTCHADAHESFRKTGMGRSFHKALKANSAADFSDHEPVYDEHLDFYYYPYFDGADMMIKEFRLDDDGDTTHQRTEAINYIIGSGNHTNSHIMEINGYLYQVPVTWYDQEKHWDLPPGYEDGRNTRFDRVIGLECINCHNARPDFDFRSVNRFDQVPLGIDCESCHGPGELHYLRMTEGEGPVNTENDTDYTIVNPAKLPLDFQVDVCQQCHLQGNAVLNPDKTFLDFRPGMRLHEVWQVFLPEYEDDERFIMASHAERMRESPCYKHTRPGTEMGDHHQITPLNCITCHDPHISVDVTAKEHFVQSCQDCHQPMDHPCTESHEVRKAKEDNCIECHMPRSGTIDIPHVTITDHFIRVPDADTQYAHQSPDMIDEEYSKLRNMTGGEPNNLTTASAYLLYFERFDPQPFLLDTALQYLNKVDTSRAINHFIHYHYLNSNYSDITRLALTYPEKIDSNANTWYHIGQSFMNQNDPDGGRTYFQKAVNDKPFHLEYREKLAVSLMMLGQSERALQQLAFIVNENPKIASVHNNMAFIYLNREEPENAGEHIQKALDLNPDYQAALINQTKWQLMQNRPEKALQSTQRILELNPDHQEARRLREMIRHRLGI